MKIANIVSKTELKVSNFFNVVSDFKEIDSSLPTLIVGFEYTDELFPQFNVLNVNIKDNIYWTVQKSYSRDKFQEDFNYFTNKVYLDLIKDVKYVYVDLILSSPRKIMKIIRKIYSLKDKISYRYGNMIYIYGEGLVFGVDLNLTTYIGINESKVVNKIKSMSVFYDSFENSPESFKSVFEVIDNKIRYAPCLHSILL